MKKIIFYFISRHYVKTERKFIHLLGEMIFSFSLPCGMSNFTESALLSMA